MPGDKKIITLREVLINLGDAVIEVIGPSDRLINKPVPIHESENEANITFCRMEGVKAAKLIEQTKAGVILCSKNIDLVDVEISGKTIILVKNPRLTFIRLVKAFFAPSYPKGIHSTAVISPDAEIASNVCIGPFTYIGKCKIEDGSQIYGHVYIYDNTRIGKDVIIHAGTVIGSDGFGYQRNKAGELEKFPHIGGVVIEDEVEIGSNVSIDRGTLGNTVIQNGAKIDNLVHIAHNVIIGKHAAVISHAMVAGSAQVGEYSWIAPCACLRDEISVGKKAMVGLGSVVTRDVPDNAAVMGVPAKAIEEHKDGKDS